MTKKKDCERIKKSRLSTDKVMSGAYPFFAKDLFYDICQIGIQNVLRRIVVEAAVNILDFFTDKGVVGSEKSGKH